LASAERVQAVPTSPGSASFPLWHCDKCLIPTMCKALLLNTWSLILYNGAHGVHTVGAQPVHMGLTTEEALVRSQEQLTSGQVKKKCPLSNRPTSKRFSNKKLVKGPDRLVLHKSNCSIPHGLGTKHKACSQPSPGLSLFTCNSHPLGALSVTRLLLHS
jgi:hypothetical protein